MDETDFNSNWFSIFYPQQRQSQRFGEKKEVYMLVNERNFT